MKFKGQALWGGPMEDQMMIIVAGIVEGSEEVSKGETASEVLEKMERETGFEPATLALARRCSTTELFPLISLIYLEYQRMQITVNCRYYFLYYCLRSAFRRSPCLLSPSLLSEFENGGI